MSTEDQEHNIEKMASAIEDLIYMGVIKFSNNIEHNEMAVFSPQFSIIISNVLAGMENSSVDAIDKIMKVLYYSLLIYFNEHLKLPKSLTMALGNDFEKYHEDIQSMKLISNYVSILQNIYEQANK